MTGEGVSMRVDRDDRYVSEQPNKDSTPSFKLPNILPNFSKTKLIILGLTIVIILLLLSLIIFRSSHKNEPTPLTPPVVNGDSSIEDNSTLTDENSNVLTQPNDLNSTTNPQDTTLNPSFNQNDGNNNPNDLTNEQNNNQITTSEQRGRTNTPSTPNNINSVNGSSNSHNTESTQSQNTPERNTLNNNEGELNLAKTGKLESNHFSIQISASSSINNLKKFANEHKITNYQIYETKRNNSPWFVLIKGNYASANDAKKAIQALPSSLQKDKPWVKPAATINKEKAIK